jgi:hypothetical protein
VDLNDAPEAERLRSLWAVHAEKPFPPEVDKAEEGGADLVMLDADLAGVIVTVLGSRRPPDIGQQRVLRGCIEELDRIQVAEPAQVYFSRLREMADLTLLTAGHQR